MIVHFYHTVECTAVELARRAKELGEQSHEQLGSYVKMITRRRSIKRLHDHSFSYLGVESSDIRAVRLVLRDVSGGVEDDRELESWNLALELAQAASSRLLEDMDALQKCHSYWLSVVSSTSPWSPTLLASWLLHPLVHRLKSLVVVGPEIEPVLSIDEKVFMLRSLMTSAAAALSQVHDVADFLDRGSPSDLPRCCIKKQQ